MSVQKDLLKIAIDSIKIDLNAISNGLIDAVLEPALQKVVDDSSNPFDNAAMAMLYPILEVEAKKLLAVEIAKLEAKIKELSQVSAQ